MSDHNNIVAAYPYSDQESAWLSSYKSRFRKEFSEESKNVSNVTVGSVRECFTKGIKDGSIDESTIHPKDIEMMEKSNKFIQNYIDEGVIRKKEKLTDDQVVSKIVKVLTFRQEFKLNEYESKDFPIELIQLGFIRQAILPNGDLLLCAIGRKYKRSKGWNRIILLFGLWYFDQLERSIPLGTKIHLLVDATNCGWEQVDIKLFWILVPILIKYFTTALYKLYWYNIPWFLRSSFKFGLHLFPPYFHDKNTVVSLNDISNILGNDGIPDFLGGNLKTTILNIPDEISDLETVGINRGIERKNIDEFKRIIQDATLML